MLRSRSNALMSVRRVTQDNRGKNTPGVDKLVVKTPQARGALVDQIQGYQPWRVRPVRRVYIAKSNGKLRPLGIPTILDRSMQAIVKNALEPEWEARFEPCSYGFRPGRSCHDAIAQIFNLARPNTRRKWVLDADIKGAFDNICHQVIEEATQLFPAKALIKQWLKAGYMESGSFHATEMGTPQGGVISPLLANIAFHGMEKAIGIADNRPGRNRGKRAIVRYADDFVIFCETREDAQIAQEEIQAWLATRGMQLSEQKTRIVHLTEGFNFLGFNIRHYPAPQTSRTGWKLLIRPSKESQEKFRKNLRNTWELLKGQNITQVLLKINPILRGWANYFRIGVAKEVFRDLDHWIFTRCVRWLRFSHPNKSWQWLCKQYWGNLNPKYKNQWVFGDKATGTYLLQMVWTPIVRHVLIQHGASPDDPALTEYWANRAKRQIYTLPPKWMGLARKQQGICPLCQMSLYNGEELHQHHRQPRQQGGKTELSNLCLVHLYCHQQVHSDENRLEALQFA